MRCRPCYQQAQIAVHYFAATTCLQLPMSVRQRLSASRCPVKWAAAVGWQCCMLSCATLYGALMTAGCQFASAWASKLTMVTLKLALDSPAGHGGCGDPQEAAHCAQGICARDQRRHPGGASEAPAGEARAAQAAAGRGCQVRRWAAYMCAVCITILSGAALSSSMVRPVALGSAF